MSNSVQREVSFPQPRDRVWQAITTSETLAEWMYPNDFAARVGHHFTFRVPANPAVKFDGLTVRCEVLECDPPHRLVFSWSVGGPVTDTRVTFRLEPEGTGTRLYFEHAGFDMSHPHASQAFKGAGYGWAAMFKQLATVLEKIA